MAGWPATKQDIGKIFMNVGLACWAAGVYNDRHPGK